MTDINDLLMGVGAKSAKFEAVGDTVVGIIERMDARQRTEMGSGKPLFWPDGNPQQQLVITLQTDDRTDDEDDGRRNLYVAIPSALQKAIADAVKRAGVRGMVEGGKLGVKHHDVAPAKQKGFSPQKLYTAKYEAPVTVMDDTFEPSAEDSPF